MDLREVFETGLLYHHYANTAYPLTPKSFTEYKLRDEKEIYDLVTEEWKKAEELSLYIHVPFCKTRCKFCEYVVLENADEDAEDMYVDLLLREMEMYSKILGDKPIVGYDLGGGTPAKLSTENLLRITEAVKRLFNIKDGVVFSIETTPLIAANDPEKLIAIRKMGYERISMGVQTVSEKLLSELGRDGSASIYERAVKNIRAAGFERFNIDLMYGFLHQSDADFKNTVAYAMALEPEYITLYRNRYKGTKLEYEAGGVSIYKAMHQYRIAYDALNENGFCANVGKNTFSRVEGDYGTSDYLTGRVINGTPYIGMGLGAQSFGMNYLAYNLGAAEKKLDRYKRAIEAGALPFQDIYRLPEDESIAKMVSVAFYFAFVDLKAFKKRFGVEFYERFEDEVKFVLEEGLMERIGERLYLTDKGSDFINGVIPLFYSDRSKKELKHAFSGKSVSAKSDEEVFLEAYDMADYERPSVAVDVAAFTLVNEKQDNYRVCDKGSLAILLIKRGEHPFMNRWALPGGFVRSDETLEECAMREITEEAGITPSAILPIGSFSKPDRDPRGRIISCAYTSVIAENEELIRASDDAIDAKWFGVTFEEYGGEYFLTLTNGKTELKAKLIKKNIGVGRPVFEIADAGEIAFDHAAIIANAISTLRREAGNYDLIFDFLPERFTLSSLQKIWEILTDTKELQANFRRKLAPYVEETEEYSGGKGHRPAKLYRRKM